MAPIVGLPTGLRDLVELLSGRRSPQAGDDWIGIIAAANACWLGPALSAALASARTGSVPEDVGDYLEMLHAMNRERNGALRAQLFDAAAVLAEVGIRPVLGKGAVFLFTAEDDELGTRMMGDLDLTVAPNERDAARLALARAGYRCWRAPNEDSDVLFRARDAGPIELHSPMPGHPAYAALDRLAAEPELVERNGTTVLIPGPTVRLLHLVLHDEIRDGGLYRGSFDLRHLFDGARILASGRVDGTILATAPVRPREKRAVAEWLLLVEVLTGAGNPLPPPSEAVRCRVRQRLLQTGSGPGPSLLRMARRALWLAERIRRGEASPLHAIRRLSPSRAKEDADEMPIRALGSGPRLG